jgi:hypothetical protein
LLLGLTSTSALAADTLGPPPWKSPLCPPIGADTGCQYGIDVTAVDGSGVAATDSILEDSNQGPYDKDDDAYLVIKNDSAAPMTAVHVGSSGSGQKLFDFDKDGICSGKAHYVKWTPPAGCPFDASPDPAYKPTTYEGPGTYFTVDDTTLDSGYVRFNPALQPGQTTYFSLEADPGVIPILNGGGGSGGGGGNGSSIQGDWITSTSSSPGYAPTSSLTVPSGVNVTDQAVVNGVHGYFDGVSGDDNSPSLKAGDHSAGGTVTYELFANDATCSSSPVYVSAAEPVSGGLAAPSGAVGATLPAGRYYWLDHYSGDAANAASTSICGQDVLDLGSTRVSPSLSSSLVTPGTPVTEKATLTGVDPEALSGTVTYAIYTDKACRIPYPKVPGAFKQPAKVSGGTATSSAMKLSSGIYWWKASYSGDAKNAPGSSSCGSAVLHVANNSFKLIGKPKIEKNYRIVFKFSITDPGRFSWSFATPNNPHVFAEHPTRLNSHHKCPKGKVRFGKRRCIPATVGYGHGALRGNPKLITVTVRPSRAVVKALERGLTLKLKGILTFHSNYGGRALSVPVRITVRGLHCTKGKKGRKTCVRCVISKNGKLACTKAK